MLKFIILVSDKENRYNDFIHVYNCSIADSVADFLKTKY